MSTDIDNDIEAPVDTNVNRAEETNTGAIVVDGSGEDLRAYVSTQGKKVAARGLMLGDDDLPESDAQGAVSSILQIASLAVGRSSIALNIGVPWGIMDKYFRWLRVDFFFNVLIPNMSNSAVNALQVIAYFWFTCFLWSQLYSLMSFGVKWPKQRDWVRSCWKVVAFGVLPTLLLCSVGATMAFLEDSNDSTVRVVAASNASSAGESTVDSPASYFGSDDKYRATPGFTGWLIRENPDSACLEEEANSLLAFGITDDLLLLLLLLQYWQQ